MDFAPFYPLKELYGVDALIRMLKDVLNLMKIPLTFCVNNFGMSFHSSCWHNNEFPSRKFLSPFTRMRRDADPYFSVPTFIYSRP